MTAKRQSLREASVKQVWRAADESHANKRPRRFLPSWSRLLKEDGGKTSWQESHPPCFHLCLFSLLPLNIEAAVHACVCVCIGVWKWVMSGRATHKHMGASHGYKEIFLLKYRLDFWISVPQSASLILYMATHFYLFCLSPFPSFVSALLSFCLFFSVAVSRYGRHGRVQLHRQ